MKHVLITGASKGIGRAAALLLAKRGFHVFAGVRNMVDGDSLAAAGGITPLQLDITDAEQLAKAAERIAQETKSEGLFGLVNNAGVAVAAPLEFVPLDDFRSQMEINLIAQLAVTQAMLPQIRQARGRIVNITSVGGRIAGQMIGVYHASKFALEALTDTLRQELSPWGIEVIAVEPGMIATPIWDTSLSAFDRLLARMNPRVHDYYAESMQRSQDNARTATTRGLPPEKVAESIHEALASARPRTRYIVGTDAQIGIRVLSRLPDRLRDRAMASR